MAEHITRLQHLHSNVYEDIDESSEPVFTRTVERGEVQFWHQTGYGYLPESRVEIVGVEGCAEHGQWELMQPAVVKRTSGDFAPQQVWPSGTVVTRPRGVAVCAPKPDAWVPIHPRNGPLWSMTTDKPDAERLPASYPLRPLVFADGVTSTPARRETRPADPNEPEAKIARREGYDEGWNDCLSAAGVSLSDSHTIRSAHTGGSE